MLIRPIKTHFNMSAFAFTSPYSRSSNHPSLCKCMIRSFFLLPPIILTTSICNHANESQRSSSWTLLAATNGANCKNRNDVHSSFFHYSNKFFHFATWHHSSILTLLSCDYVVVTNVCVTLYGTFCYFFDPVYSSLNCIHVLRSSLERNIKNVQYWTIASSNSWRCCICQRRNVIDIDCRVYACHSLLSNCFVQIDRMFKLCVYVLGSTRLFVCLFVFFLTSCHSACGLNNPHWKDNFFLKHMQYSSYPACQHPSQK